MHYFRGRHSWVIAAAVAVVLLVAAIASHIARQDLVPMAPGPIPAQKTVGSL